ncbi:MAG: GYD domain-containing protein [Gemmatimonadota bacterium]
MPTYLWQASYTAEGAKGLLKDGGTKRRAAVQQMVEKAGGKLHSFFFALGKADVCGIAEFPDSTSALGMSLAINASGAVEFQTTLLISPEEMDAAVKQAVKYSPPGA